MFTFSNIHHINSQHISIHGTQRHTAALYLVST